MHEEAILDGSDDTIGGSTQTQRRIALKDTMKTALLILDSLDRSSIKGLAKDQDYRKLVHRFLSPLTDLPLQDAVNQAIGVLKNGLDEISRGMARLYPAASSDPIDNPIHSAPSRALIPASDLLSSFPGPQIFSELSLSLTQHGGPPNPPPLTPLQQIHQNRRKMVTIHFIVSGIRYGTTLKNVIDAVNEVIWKKRSKKEQRVLEAWATKKGDIVLAFQSPLDTQGFVV